MRKAIRLAPAMLVLALVATACPNGDDGTAGGGEDLLQQVKDRGTLRCGVNNTVPGFGFVTEGGEFRGFDIDFCKAVAAAVLGDATKVEYKPLAAEQRFTALQSGEVDVLIRNTTWTAARDGELGADFVTTTFFDGQGMMVRADSDYRDVEDMAGTTICVISGTTTEQNLETVFRARRIRYTPLSLEDAETIRDAFIRGRCQGWTSDKSQLAGLRSSFPQSEGGPDALRILTETLSKEPLGPAVREGNPNWFDAVNWTVMATIQAEEFGITQANVDTFLNSENPDIKRFVGRAQVTSTASPSPGASPATRTFNPGLGLPDDFGVQVVRAVGNYEEIFNRNVGPRTSLGLTRGINALWTEGGLMYPVPYR